MAVWEMTKTVTPALVMMGLLAFSGRALYRYVEAASHAEDVDAVRCRQHDGFPVFGWHGRLVDCRPLPRR